MGRVTRFRRGGASGLAWAGSGRYCSRVHTARMCTGGARRRGGAGEGWWPCRRLCRAQVAAADALGAWIGVLDGTQVGSGCLGPPGGSESVCGFRMDSRQLSRTRHSRGKPRGQSDCRSVGLSDPGCLRVGSLAAKATCLLSSSSPGDGRSGCGAQAAAEPDQARTPRQKKSTRLNLFFFFSAPSPYAYTVPTRPLRDVSVQYATVRWYGISYA